VAGLERSERTRSAGLSEIPAAAVFGCTAALFGRAAPVFTKQVSKKLQFSEQKAHLSHVPPLRAVVPLGMAVAGRKSAICGRTDRRPAHVPAGGCTRSALDVFVL
jgi:hypothetical protein